MKLSHLLQAEEALRNLYTKKFRDGALGYRVLKEIRRLEEEVQKWYEYRNKVIQETGKQEISPDDPAYSDVVKKLQESLEVEVEGSRVVIPLGELGEMSPKDLDVLEKLGFVGEVQDAAEGRKVEEGHS